MIPVCYSHYKYPYAHLIGTTCLEVPQPITNLDPPLAPPTINGINRISPDITSMKCLYCSIEIKQRAHTTDFMYCCLV